MARVAYGQAFVFSSFPQMREALFLYFFLGKKYQKSRERIKMAEWTRKFLTKTRTRRYYGSNNSFSEEIYFRPFGPPFSQARKWGAKRVDKVNFRDSECLPALLLFGLEYD
ncbi:hypothetical protein A2524_01445 [Candidatus Wolfebacteria bacterium RIFOXYD12_FULL_48_21]|uniref:Uncharacterized protein n=1 Tax=Candidatus Wolfebacteria bacterium RIFOXYD1_FULL_48_65 TaxID=1802561 RepID=A0A1F8E437_9BACT|nr:MAG: hypothetical protein A2524_01445 [Candidatus Wolfebacteria bacterium RIFOXYD12_FULL_48_21]OGM95606.1 MAG: hypothetical protein A2610_00705 [Candidatus Wolfebacteria bacterium RIFOXYD1_FULL_48_65]OGM97937.1 MAG: hypothetical protein A2532_04355 [Candidatus Wolfebacteria bacterium RIFOXYD2_FULL_48_11]